jgi:tetratricopeptide (TPR) repeat protein
VTVEVLRLPERNKIEQPISDARLDTAKGQWRFEHMKFEGPGSYEIVATAYFNHRSSFIPISVKCVQKISAYKLSVARERGLRGAPDKFVPLSSDMTHDGVMMQLASLQDQFIAAYLKSNDLGRSLEAVNRAFDLLDPAIEAFPSDPDIQALRAFFLKNYAMVERDLGEPQKFQAALDEATLMFEALTVQRPEDWNGWNGMGSVFILRNEPEKALLYIDKSLELQPGNQFAQQDRDAAIQLLNRKAGEAHSSAAASK